MAKSCPITRADFREHAQAIKIEIDGKALTAEVKEFSTGSLGWYLNDKTTVEIGGKRVTVQIGLNLTIIGSKDLPKDDAPAAEASEE